MSFFATASTRGCNGQLCESPGLNKVLMELSLFCLVASQFFPPGPNNGIELMPIICFTKTSIDQCFQNWTLPFLGQGNRSRVICYCDRTVVSMPRPPKLYIHLCSPAPQLLRRAICLYQHNFFYIVVIP